MFSPLEVSTRSLSTFTEVYLVYSRKLLEAPSSFAKGIVELNSSFALLVIELNLAFISYSELSSFSSSSSSLSTSLSSPPAPIYAYLAIIGRALEPRTLLPALSIDSVSLLALPTF